MSKIKKKVSKALDANLDRDIASIRDGARRDLSVPAQRYLRCLVDPRAATPTGVPTAIGGYPGRTAAIKLTQRLTFNCGTSGVGFVSLQPGTTGLNQGYVTGPFSDTNVITWSTGSWASNTVQQAGTLVPTGITQAGWARSPYQMATVQEMFDFGYRIVGAAIEVFPESSFSDQNGELTLIELPGHESLNDKATGFNLASGLGAFELSRTVRAVQTGSQREKVVINWHPRSRHDVDSERNDFDFAFVTPGTTPQTGWANMDGIVVAAKGAAGTQFHATVTAIYELKGRKVPGVKPRAVDSRGMDLVFNAIMHKTMDGYVGVPDHVYHGYLASIWHAGKKLWGFARENERRLMDTAKSVASIAGIAL